jgi:hypothetical protein
MPNPDELRDRIARLDPMPAEVPTEPVTSTSARALLEEIMSTTTDQTAHTDPTGTSGGAAPTPPPAGRGRSRWTTGWIPIGIAAAAIAVAVTGGAALTGAFGSDDEPTIADGTDTPTVLSLSLGDGPGMASCLAPSADILADIPIAFAGTAVDVDGELVTLEVIEWYAGGDADVVELTAPAGMEALIGGIDFQPGQPYLVSAFDGVVNYCGFTGPATPELQALFDEAFPG